MNPPHACPPGAAPLPAKSSTRLALFDLDHTLLPFDSDHAWGQFTVQLGWHEAQSFSRANNEFYASYQAGTLDIAQYVRFATSALRQRSAQEVHQAQALFMQNVVRPALHPAAIELVRAHQEAGEQVIIVTATNEFITRPIAQALGVSELIAVELERNEQGELTGHIRGTPSFGAGKVARVEQWLHTRALRWPDVQHSTFYSDSINDLPLLEKVHQPVATNPDAQLLAIASARHWRILQLFA